MVLRKLLMEMWITKIILYVAKLNPAKKVIWIRGNYSVQYKSLEYVGMRAF